MKRPRRWLVVACMGAVGLFAALLVFSRIQNLDRVDPSALENDVRAALPMGTPSDVVKQYLVQRNMEIYADPYAHTVQTVVRSVRGTNFLVRKDMGIKFDFDENSKLQTIETKINLTGL